MKKKSWKLSAALLSSLMLLSACGGGGTSSASSSPSSSGGDAPTVQKKEYLGDKTVGENTVKVYGSQNVKGAYKTVGFEETNNLCADNEGQGWVIH